jgi:hypothetical protein
MASKLIDLRQTLSVRRKRSSDRAGAAVCGAYELSPTRWSDAGDVKTKAIVGDRKARSWFGDRAAGDEGRWGAAWVWPGRIRRRRSPGFVRALPGRIRHHDWWRPCHGIVALIRSSGGRRQATTCVSSGGAPLVGSLTEVGRRGSNREAVVGTGRASHSPSATGSGRFLSMPVPVPVAAAPTRASEWPSDAVVGSTSL